MTRSFTKSVTSSRALLANSSSTVVVSQGSTNLPVTTSVSSTSPQRSSGYGETSTEPSSSSRSIRSRLQLNNTSHGPIRGERPTFVAAIFYLGLSESTALLLTPTARFATSLMLYSGGVLKKVLWGCILTLMLDEVLAHKIAFEFDNFVRRRDIDLGTLHPFQRSLLYTDGTVTELIEAYVLEPIKVTVISQDRLFFRSYCSNLDTESFCPLVLRQVVLIGERSQTVYCYAVSICVISRLSETQKEMLLQKRCGIGQILKMDDVFTKRKLLSIGLGYCNQGDNIFKYLGGGYLSRLYSIHMEPKPAFLINENFPLVAPYRPDQH